MSRIHTYCAGRDARYRFTVDVESGTPCELFDLVADPGELDNRVENGSMREIVRALQTGAPDR